MDKNWLNADLCKHQVHVLVTFVSKSVFRAYVGLGEETLGRVNISPKASLEPMVNVLILGGPGRRSIEVEARDLLPKPPSVAKQPVIVIAGPMKGDLRRVHSLGDTVTTIPYVYGDSASSRGGRGRKRKGRAKGKSEEAAVNLAQHQAYELAEIVPM